MSMPDYAEYIISGRLSGFRFQPRAGTLQLKAISHADISQIIRRNDHTALQTLLNNTNIINADVSGEDFDFHSSDFLVKLFQICQLSLDFSNATNSMLQEELNEVNRVSKINAKNLRRQDEVVATLKDELFHCKEALKKAEEQSPDVSRMDHRRMDHNMFPSQERRFSSSSSDSDDDEDDSEQPITNDATEIKLHIVLPHQGLYIPLIVDETFTLRTLQNKIIGSKREGCGIDFEQWSLYYQNQKVQCTGTLKDHQIMNDSALVLLPSSSSTMEAKLDDIKSMLECQAAMQESNTELLVKEMTNCNEILEEVLRTEHVDRTDDVITTPSDMKSPSLEANNDEQHDENHLEAQARQVYPWRQKDGEQEKPELKVDTTEEWPFGLNFDTVAGPPKEINVSKNTSDGGSPSNDTIERAAETTAKSNSPTKADYCGCFGEEVCDECVNPSSPLSSEAVITITKNIDQVDEHFTFSEFDNTNTEEEKFTSTDYDYSCDKSDFESLHIGAKEANVVTDTDLQSIEMSLEEYSLGLGANEGKQQKKKSRILKKLTFKPRWKKVILKRRPH